MKSILQTSSRFTSMIVQGGTQIKVDFALALAD
jgi:hypothetical protein